MSEVAILLELVGKRRFLAGLAEAKAGMHGLATTTDRTGKVMTLTTRRTWLMNQALFTLRRLAYGVTLGFIGLGVVALKWGFDFNKTINDASVGFEGFIKGTAAIKKELSDLYYIAAVTPFTFPQIVQAARRLIPYTETLQQANQLTEDLSNSLAAAGTASGQFFTRATIQFTHILALGKVTGIQLNALSRDQIALLPMLAAYYHTTTAAVSDMVHRGLVPARDAVAALHAYQKTAGFEGKNFALATRTLTGAWATFHDVVAKGMGQATGGLFEKARITLKRMAEEFLPYIRTNKPITLYMIANALDKALSPKTHIIINLFVFFRGLLRGFLLTFGSFIRLINIVLRPLGTFGDKTHSSSVFMRVLGFTIGTVLALMLIWKFALYTTAIALGIVSLATWAWDAALTVAIISLYALEAPLLLLAIAFGALILGLVILYFKWQRFHDIVNKTAKFLWDHWYLLAMIPIFGPMILGIVVVIKYWDRFVDVIGRAYRLFIRFKNAVSGGEHKAWWQRSGLSLVGLQHGTPMVTNPGLFRVGERGPEVVHLPRGAAVSPAGAAGGLGGAFSLTIEPAPIYLDGRPIAEVVFKHHLDRIARR